jgi:hypothetical protein
MTDDPGICIIKSKRNDKMITQHEIEIAMDTKTVKTSAGVLGLCGVAILAASLMSGTAFAQQLPCQGPAGGTGGTPFNDASNGIPPGHMQSVNVRSGEYIDNLQAVLPGYVLPAHGGNGGDAASFPLSPDEYLTQLSGRYGQYVDSVVFTTNKRTSMQYGGNGGNTSYTLAAPSGYEIVGFCGRSGSLVDAIGIVIRKLDE